MINLNWNVKNRYNYKRGASPVIFLEITPQYHQMDASQDIY